MGMILHDWNLDKKKMLIQKAYEALPRCGAFGDGTFIKSG